MAEKVWIVEMQNDARLGRWMPTVGVALTREDAVRVRKDWKRRNPNDRFRLRKYIRQETAKG